MKTIVHIQYIIAIILPISLSSYTKLLVYSYVQLKIRSITVSLLLLQPFSIWTAKKILDMPLVTHVQSCAVEMAKEIDFKGVAIF